MDKIAIGVKGLDYILHGGLPKGKTILLSGDCGAGKTILASHFINQGIKHKQPGVYVSLEQDKSKLITDLKEINIDWSKHEGSNKLRIIGGKIGYIRKLKNKRRATAQDFIDEIIEIVEEVNAKRVVIDSINLFLDLFNSEREQRDALTELIYQLQELGTTLILTCEVTRRDGSISWYGFEEFVVDGVILLKRDFKNKLNYQRMLEVIKMRGTYYKQGNYPIKIVPNKGMEVFMNDPSTGFFSD